MSESEYVNFERLLNFAVTSGVKEIGSHGYIVSGADHLKPVTFEARAKIGGIEGNVISIDELKSHEFKATVEFRIGARKWRRMMRAFLQAGAEWRRTGAGLKPWHRRRLGLDADARRYYHP